MPLDLKNLPKPSNTLTKKTLDISSLLAGVNDAKVFERGQFFTKKGTYNCEVVRVVHKESEVNRRNLYIIELKILDVISQEDGGPAVGENRTVMQDLNNPNVAHGVLKQFALSCLNPSKEEYAEAVASVQAILEAAADPDRQALNGAKLRVVARDHTTKKQEKIIVTDFKPYEEVHHE